MLSLTSSKMVRNSIAGDAMERAFTLQFHLNSCKPAVSCSIRQYYKLLVVNNNTIAWRHGTVTSLFYLLMLK